MVDTSMTARVFGPYPDCEDLPRLLELANSADSPVAKEAQGELFSYLWHTHRSFVENHSRRDWGNRVTTQDLVMTVITEMLGGFGRFIDIDHLCASFRFRIVRRAIDCRKRRVLQRQAADNLSDYAHKADPKSHTDELERLDLVEHVMQALREHNPKWAAATELRFLATDDTDATYAAIGQALHVAYATVRAWVENALNWLKETYPHFRLV
jgi:RNA polymerase sigma factor (sigma-70 family)